MKNSVQPFKKYPALKLDKSGSMFTQFGNQFKDLDAKEEYKSPLTDVPDSLNAIADVEEQAFGLLAKAIV